MTNIEKRYFSQWPKIVKRVLIILAVLAILVFLGFRVQMIFSPPYLDIVEPQDGLIATERQIEIIGASQSEAEIVINNQNILVDNEGVFRTTVDLQKGLNLIKITAKKRYGREKVVELRILFK